MAYRELELTLLSARDLKNVNLITRMDVYAVATISGDPLTRQCTAPDPYGGRHPCWNATLRFNVPPTAAAAAGACLHVLLRAERVLGDRDVGEVVVPLADLLAAAPSAATAAGPQPPPRLASYQVRKVHRWEPRGVLNIAYRLGPVVAPVDQQPTVKPPVMEDPVGVPQQQPPPNGKSNGRGPAGPSQVCVGPHTQIILGAPTGPGTMVSPSGSIVTSGKPKQHDAHNDTLAGFGGGNKNISTHQHGSSTHSLSPSSSPYQSHPSWPPTPCSSDHSSNHSTYSLAHTSTPSPRPRPLGQQATSNSFGSIINTGKPKQQDTQVVRGAYATAESMSTVSPRKEDHSRYKLSSQNGIESGFGSGNGNLSAYQHGSSTHSLSPSSSPYPFTPSPSSSAHSSTHSPYSSAHTSTLSPRPLGQQAATSNSFGARATSHTDSPRSTSTRGAPASSPLPSSLVVAK